MVKGEITASFEDPTADRKHEVQIGIIAKSCRRHPDARFRYPLYRLPSASESAELRRRVGHVPTRADIDGRLVLSEMGLEQAWVDDPVARFVLDGDAITINTTLPDGSTATETYSVAAEQEAR